MDRKKLISLATKAIAGDKGAFEQLYVSHARSILFHVRSQIIDKENYNDVAQEVAIRMYKNIAQLREPAAFRGWMHQVIRTTCLNHNRSVVANEKHESPFDDEEKLEAIEDEGWESDPEAAALAKLEGNQLFAIVNELPVKHREIIVQRYYDDLSYKEIAEAQGISVTNVSTRLQRAMTAIRKVLGDKSGEYGTQDRGIAMGQDTTIQTPGEGPTQRELIEPELSAREHVTQNTAAQELTAQGIGVQESIRQDPGTQEFEMQEFSAEEPTAQELKEQGLNDDIGLSPALYSGITALIPEAAVKTFTVSTGAKLAAITATAAATQGAAVVSTAAKALPAVIAYSLAAASVVFALVVGGTALSSVTEAEESTTSSVVVQHEYPTGVNILFSDARGGSTDLNVIYISVVEDEPSSIQTNWNLFLLTEQEGAAPDGDNEPSEAIDANEAVEGKPAASNQVLLQSGSGNTVDSSLLTTLGPGNYHVVFMLEASNGATAEVSRSFTIAL